MSDLTDFLLARIAEDEAWAKAASGWQTGSRHEGQPLDWSIHMDRWSPDRVRAECEAKRRIVEEAYVADCIEDDLGTADEVQRAWPYVGERILRALALPYADHPDFLEEWRT